MKKLFICVVFVQRYRHHYETKCQKVFHQKMELFSVSRACIDSSGRRVCTLKRYLPHENHRRLCFWVSLHPSCVCRARICDMFKTMQRPETQQQRTTISLATAVPAPYRICDNDSLDRVKPEIIINSLGFGIHFVRVCVRACACHNTFTQQCVFVFARLLFSRRCRHACDAMPYAIRIHHPSHRSHLCRIIFG